MEQIIATYVVKPSSPTPVELKTHALSIIDQMNPQVYIPLIFFYLNDQSQQHTQISHRLRQSLAEILTISYPLAGKINGNSSVYCNDSGAEMVEARIHARLQDFTQDPNTEELRRLLPSATSPHEDDGLLSVKINFFDCGGVAVGINFSHKLGDLSSLAMFMNSWATACRGEASRIISPSFDLALRFPPRDMPNTSQGITNEKIITKRFVFNSEKLQTIKKQYAGEKVKDPTSVEALSAFIWQTVIEAYKSKSSSSLSSSSSLIHFVNLRPKTIPPIPDSPIGNCVVPAVAMVSWEEEERERERGSGVYVSKIRAVIRGVDSEYIKNVVGDPEKYMREVGQADDAYKAGNWKISSWWRFPLYDVNFGWGKPVWVCTTTLPFSNAILLMSTPSEDGIEAWVNTFDDEIIMMLQDNYENLKKLSDGVSGIYYHS